MFKRKAHISIKYALVFKEMEGKMKKYRYPEKYAIHIAERKNSKMINGLDPNNTKSIIDALLNAEVKKKGLRLEMKFNSVISQKFIIPKWAVRELIDKIQECIGYTSSKDNPEKIKIQKDDIVYPFFKKKAYISIEYELIPIEIDGKTNKYRVPKFFSINIREGENIRSLRNLDISNVREIMDKLKKADKEKESLLLEKELEAGLTDTILIPKWATKDLIAEIYNCNL